jgi:hypothetical protein
MRTKIGIGVLLVALAVALGSASAVDVAPKPLAIANAVYHLHYDAAHESFSNRVALVIRNISDSASDMLALQMDDGDDYTAVVNSVSSPAVRDWTTEYDAEGRRQLIYVRLNRPLQPEQTTELELQYQVKGDYGSHQHHHGVGDLV